MKKKASIIKFSLVAVFVFIGLFFSFVTTSWPGFTTLNSFASTIKLGLDLKGGVYAVYEIAETEDTENLSSRLDGTRTRLQELLQSKGYTEATVVVEGTTRLRVEVPDVDDPSDIFTLIGKPASIEFVDHNDVIILTGENVTSAKAGYYSSSADYAVYLDLDSAGTSAFADATSSENTGQAISIYTEVDGERTLISSPTINDQIVTGSAVITGMGSLETAQALADQITAGMFEVKLSLLESSTVSATLGDDALTRSLIAGIIGIILIMVFMCLIYRGYGILSSLALLIYSVLMITLLALLPWIQLTLPGIAGILLSIGMAVDGNVIIFERIKAEYRNGKSVRASAYAGRRKALSAILDGNITTVIASIVLLIFGTGSVQSFALTLLVGIVLALFINLVVIRFFIDWILNITHDNPAFFNLKRGKDFVEGTEDDTYGKISKKEQNVVIDFDADGVVVQDIQGEQPAEYNVANEENFENDLTGGEFANENA